MLQSWLQSTIRRGRLTVHGAGPNPITAGPGGDSGPIVHVRIDGPATALRLALNPDLELGEAFMDGRLQIVHGDLDSLFELIGLNLRTRPPASRLRSAWTRLWNRRRVDQKPSGAARNVAHHYDLSDDFYRLFLDPQMQYSCAYFETPDMDLAEAQRAKIAHILSKLDLNANQRVLDIGCGWGGLALAIARHSQARVTGITLSRRQLEVARRRAALEGLSDRVTFELTDYRDVTGEFERIVSVGMLEHVGPGHYRSFFDTLNDRLTPDGVALVHAIGARVDGGGSNPWIRKYIFPGGYIPTLGEVLLAAEPSRLWTSDVEVLRLHYARTLTCWLERFRAQRALVRQRYDERFCRMWEFYLASCAMSFRHGDLMVMQMQFTKQLDSLPVTRSYMAEAEARLRRAVETASRPTAVA